MDYKALIKSLSRRSREVLDQICCDDDSCHPISTLKSLTKKGLIERYTAQWDFLTIYRYRVSFAVHMAWCEVCTEEETEIIL